MRLFVALFWISKCLAEEIDEKTQLTLLDEKFKQYNKVLAPSYRVDVTVNIFVDTMSSISEASMDYDLTLFFRQFWNEPRLAWGLENNLTRKDEIYSIDCSYIEQIWIPDLFFVDEKESRRHEIFRKNALLEIRPNGDIMFSERLTLKIGCKMHLGLFPFDSQRCPLNIESYSLRKSQLRINWAQDNTKRSPILLSQDISSSLPSYSINGCLLRHTCDQSYVTGEFSCLTGYFQLARNLSFYVVHLFVPSTLCVFISWLSFWINLEIAPARVTLGITTFLAIIAETQYFNQEMPKVSYIKAVDIWNFVCITFVFLSIAEYCLAHIYLKKETRKKLLQDQETAQDQENAKKRISTGERDVQIDILAYDAEKDSTKISSVNSPESSRGRRTGRSMSEPNSQQQFNELIQRLHSTVELQNVEKSTMLEKSTIIDRWSRRIFPSTFAVFVFIFFLTCGIIQGDTENDGLDDIDCLS